jgi:hypothetical protein
MLFSTSRFVLSQFPSKIAIASSTLAPWEIIAWQAAVIRTASSVDFWWMLRPVAAPLHPLTLI